MPRIGTIQRNANQSAGVFSPPSSGGDPHDKVGLGSAANTVGFVLDKRKRPGNCIKHPTLGDFKVDQKAADRDVVGTSTKWKLKIVAVEAQSPATVGPADTIASGSGNPSGGGVAIPPIGNAVQYVIDEKIWPKAIKGLTTERWGVMLPLPGVNTGPRVPYSQMERVSNFKPVSGKAATATSPADPKIYKNMWISGGVKLDGLHDVEFIDCKIDGLHRAQGKMIENKGSLYCISTKSAKSITVRYCELSHACSACYYGDNTTLEYNCIHHGAADLAKPQVGNVIRFNYFAMAGYGNPAAHADIFQTIAGHDNLIEYNFIDADVTSYPIGEYFECNAVWQHMKNNGVPGSGNYNNVFNRNWVRSETVDNGLWMYDSIKAGTCKVTENLLMGTKIHAGSWFVISGNTDLAGNTIKAV